MFRKLLKLNTISIALTAILISASLIFCLPAPPALAATETLNPTTYTFSAGGTNQNPQYAYDTSTTTYNNLGVGDNNADPTMEYHTWQTSSNEHSERRLYIRRRGRNNGTGSTADTWSISYSINGGTDYTVIESGLTNPGTGNTPVVYIPTDLDLSQLVVKISTFLVGSNNNGTARIYNVWLECDYSALPLVGTQIGAEYPIVVNPTTLTPQEQWTTITVPVAHGEGLSHIDYVEVKLFYDSAGNDPNESGFSADVHTCAVLSWTRSGFWGIWAIEPSGTTWALNSGGCSKPWDYGTQGNWVFSFQIGKVATYSAGAADWDIYAEALDDYSATGYDYLRDTEMNWYEEISVNTSDVTWSGVSPGDDFSDTTKETDISVTYIANGSYYQRVAATTPWTGSLNNAVLDESGTPGSLEFSLKADDVDNLPSAVLVTAYPSYVTINTATQTDESGITVTTNTLWLKLGVIPTDSYSGTIYYMITNTS
jgi:hypothetical protein